MKARNRCTVVLHNLLSEKKDVSSNILVHPAIKEIKLQ